MQTKLLSLGLLATAGTTLAQTPPYFEPSTDVNLPATFDANTTSPDFFTVGGVFSINATQEEPQLYVTTNATYVTHTNGSQPPTFIILMVDPDAPSPQNTSFSQILHWLQPGVRLSRSVEPTPGPNNTALVSMLSEADTDTPAIAPYIPPAPPSVAPHRYIIMLFRQPGDADGDFELPDGFEQYKGGEERTGFDAKEFVEAAGLGEPLAATYFLVGKETSGNGSATYEGDDAAAGIGGNTTVPASATSSSASASAAGASGSAGASATASGGAAAASETSGAERVVGVAALSAVAAGFVALVL
ncbi:Phosphatidylethanolamine-binding protein PEBP [Lasiodiplodia theobromae]|uniref:Phosphatidylethanolamine-binding protein PEBP n=1 Tax=Lasiodiplodia theobromae TaxID=45133 RepID=UPI0015C341AA|nr:Phosphatidylethanolamine-binding protein PEBP [Lasiodiplodia theobromae]KAF4545410.1 Phosphatidylethanolamine-binding protein PEBP [Lasiodiplodia theobromae]KAF9639153.1 Phosphatidylethanolamine-binding protein PEBP [Lasiodiplodia theobromae]